jgi:hypothetical protein
VEVDSHAATRQELQLLQNQNRACVASNPASKSSASPRSARVRASDPPCVTGLWGCLGLRACTVCSLQEAHANKTRVVAQLVDLQSAISRLHLGTCCQTTATGKPPDTEPPTSSARVRIQSKDMDSSVLLMTGVAQTCRDLQAWSA